MDSVKWHVSPSSFAATKGWYNRWCSCMYVLLLPRLRISSGFFKERHQTSGTQPLVSLPLDRDECESHLPSATAPGGEGVQETPSDDQHRRRWDRRQLNFALSYNYWFSLSKIVNLCVGWLPPPSPRQLIERCHDVIRRTLSFVPTARLEPTATVGDSTLDCLKGFFIISFFLLD